VGRPRALQNQWPPSFRVEGCSWPRIRDALRLRCTKRSLDRKALGMTRETRPSPSLAGRPVGGYYAAS
jgi:hypothetical protein